MACTTPKLQTRSYHTGYQNSDAGQQTICKIGNNISLYEGNSQELRYHRILQLHGRVYFDPVLRNTEFSLGHVQQLLQQSQLDKEIHLKTPTCHTFPMNLPEHISTQQDQQIPPQEEVRGDNSGA